MISLSTTSDYQTIEAQIQAVYAFLQSQGIGTGQYAKTVISQTAPTDTTVVWYQIDSLGRLIRYYTYATGQNLWLATHPSVPGTSIWWFQALPNFATFDGGDAGGLSVQTGPMWQQAVDSNGNVIAAKFPIPAGTLPSSTVLALGNTGGEENHVMVPGEDVPHLHNLIFYGTGIPSNGNNVIGGGNGTTGPFTYTTEPKGGVTTTSGDPDKVTLVSTQPDNANPVTSYWKANGHNTMPPYVVGYLIQRTTRIFYVGH